VASHDVLADPRISLTAETRGLLETALFGSELAVPMVLAGRLIGALAVADRKGRVYTEEEIRLAETFADHAAVALGNAQLFEANRRQSDELAALAALARLVADGVDLDRLAGEVHRHAARLLGAEAVLVARYEEDGRVVQSAWGVAEGTLESSLPAPDQLMTRAVMGRQAARGSPDAGVAGQTRGRHWVALPLLSGPRVVGGLAVSRAGEPFSGAEEPLLTTVAAVVGLALRPS
jgi:GAF domain-containing protein